jgi:hypothetical protein
VTLTALAGFRIHPPLKELKDPYSRTAARRDSSSCALFFGTCLARLSVMPCMICEEAGFSLNSINACEERKTQSVSRELRVHRCAKGGV